MRGDVLSFSESDIAATAAAYDPAKHEAPLVIGHPKHDAPAYGWVKSLAASGDGLNAEPHQVDADFAELVASGRYKKISASFYLPDAPNNPVPGVYYLRHVGFLGAQPPAVKGLNPVQFADDGGDCVSFEFAEEDVSGILRRMAGWKRQVEAGSAGGGVMRRGFAQAAIENLEVDLVHQSFPVSNWAMCSTNWRASTDLGAGVSGCVPWSSNSTSRLSSPPKPS